MTLVKKFYLINTSSISFLNGHGWAPMFFATVSVELAFSFEQSSALGAREQFIREVWINIMLQV